MSYRRRRFDRRRQLPTFARRLSLAILAVALITSGGADGAVAPHRASTTPLPHVTLIGDSIATALPGSVDATRVLRQGLDLDFQVAQCRRLVYPSCPPNPPTVIELIESRGAALGPTVVLVLGYNEFEDQYAGAVEKTMDAFERVGVERVFWLTLRAARHPYVNMNDDLRAAATRHPRLGIIDWNVYSRSHPDWFQADGIHLLSGGSNAMATLIHDRLAEAGVTAPPVVVRTAALPVARRGRPYVARLTGGGGRRPYTWSLSGRLPVGLHLRPTGVLWGTARGRAGRYRFTVGVRDDYGQTGVRDLVLTLR